MSTTNLTNRTIIALFWSFGQRFGRQSIRFIITLILARLLAPEEFGLVAMISIFYAISEKFLYAGFGAALIQKADVDQEDWSTLFFFDIFAGSICYGILFMLSPWIAAFFDQPVLKLILRISALRLIFDALSVVQRMRLMKSLDFRPLTVATIFSTILTGIVGIIMALHGFGVWSLVYAGLSGRCIHCIILWLISGWKPNLIFSMSSLNYMWSFGYKILANNIVESVFLNIYQVIIGRLFTPATLGFFDRGRSLKDIAVQNFVRPLNAVFFPSIASIKDDADRLQKSFHRAIVTLSCCIFPILFGLAATADNLVPFLYSDKWIPAVPYVQLLCPIGLFYALRSLHNSLYKAFGKPEILLKIQLTRVSLTVISILVTYRWGLTVMISGEICAAGFTFILAMILTGRLIGYSFYRQLLDLAPYVIASLIMAIAVLALRKFDFEYRFLKLLLQIFTGAGLYIIICSLFKASGYNEIRTLLYNTFHQIKHRNILKTV